MHMVNEATLMFQYESEAQEVLEQLKERLAKFGLEVAEDKTRILPIGRYKGTDDSFDFLGFNFYNTKSLSGKYRLGVRTSEKKLKAKRQTVKAWLREQLTKPVSETMKAINTALQGHFNYYGVNGNSNKLKNFWLYVKDMCYRMLNRRDQKGKLKIERYWRIWDYYVKPPRLTTDIWNMKPKLA